MSNLVGLGYGSSRNTVLANSRSSYLSRDYPTTSAVPSYDRSSAYSSGSGSYGRLSASSSLTSSPRAKYNVTRTNSLDCPGVVRNPAAERRELSLTRNYSAPLPDTYTSSELSSSSSYQYARPSTSSAYDGRPYSPPSSSSSSSSYRSSSRDYGDSDMSMSRKLSKMGNLLKKVRSSSFDYGSPSSDNASTKRGSIYRRPTPPKPTSANANDVRRKQFQQNLMWYSHADAEDIPIEAYLDELNLDSGDGYLKYEEAQKRRISLSRGNSEDRSTSAGKLRSQYRDGSPGLSRVRSVDRDCEKENYSRSSGSDLRLEAAKPLKTSIRSRDPNPKSSNFNREKSKLKQKTLDDMYNFYMEEYEEPLAMPNSKTKPEATGPKTRFKEDVNVVYYDKEVGSMSESNSEKLKEEKLLQNPRICVNGDHEAAKNDVSQGSAPSSGGSGGISLPQFKADAMEVVTDSANPRKRKLKIKSKIESEYARNKTSVKALSGGLKLIILLYRYACGANGEFELTQVTKELSLPHRVDAFSVRALMDKQGCLNIEAPIVEISPGKKQLSDSDKSSETSAESSTVGD